MSMPLDSLQDACRPLTSAPVLETERLILRGPQPRDAEPMMTFLMDQ